MAAVMTYYGRGVKDPSSVALPEAAQAQGAVRTINSGPIVVGSDDMIGTRLLFGKIASSAIPLPGLSTLKHGALTSVSDFDIGLEKDGAVVELDIFADGLNLTSAGVKDPFASIPVGSWGKRVWELLGLTRDPGVEYDVVGNMKAAATASASVALIALYSQK